MCYLSKFNSEQLHQQINDVFNTPVKQSNKSKDVFCRTFVRGSVRFKII